MVVPRADIVHMVGMTYHDVSLHLAGEWVGYVHSYMDSLQVKHTVHFSCQGIVHFEAKVFIKISHKINYLSYVNYLSYKHRYI